MLSLFHQMAHENYKNGKWVAMIRNKMRIRYVNNSLSNDIILLLNENKNVAKRYSALAEKKFFIEC